MLAGVLPQQHQRQHQCRAAPALSRGGGARVTGETEVTAAPGQPLRSAVGLDVTGRITGPDYADGAAHAGAA